MPLVEATVSEILTSLGLTDIPVGCELQLTDTVELRAEVDEDDLIIREEYTELRDCVDQGDVMELSAAIRSGDLARASQLLELIFGADLTTWEWTQRGAYQCPRVAVAA